MAHIKQVKIGENTYLLEPAVYAATADTASAITAAITNFALDTGVVVNLKITTANAADATLNVNGTGAKAIRYNNENIAAGALKANRFYSLLYDGTYWQLLGELDTNTTYSAGTGIGISGTTISNTGVTGVKGSSESNYRTGDIDLTAAYVGAYSTTEIDNRLKKYLSYAHYSNKNSNSSNSGKYYKININSTVRWMLNFTVKLYHAYYAYDLQISGYNNGSNHWYSPAAIVLGASTTHAIDVIFGYDSNSHLWIAIPADAYTGIDVLNATNGYSQITDIENLFSIELVDEEPTTKQQTIKAYRPWYRDETIPIESGGTNATTAAGARTNLGLGSMATETAADYLKKSGGTMTGVFTAKGSQYDDSITSSTSHAINMNNSNIIGLNAIYTADASDGAAEGINFYRDATHFDTLWMSGGDLLFVPNRALGTNTTKANSQKVGRFTVNPATDQVVITDGTTGGMKSSGYTIAKSVPSDAKFTDTTYSAGTGISLSGTTFSNSGVLSIAGKTGAVTLADLGLSNAMHFLGVTTTNVSADTANTTATISIDGSNITAAAGDVVLYGSQEYVWGNDKWNLLGDESSYKVKQTAKADPTASTTTSTTFIDTISQDANGVITATKKTLPTASTTVAGITKVGASGGAAAYSHTHSYLANTNTGAADRPIYITGNAPAQTTYRMSGTNTTATTAIAITTDLPTGNWYVNGTSEIYNINDGVVYAEQYNSSWIHEIYGDYRTGQIAVRGKNNGTWQAWRKVLDSSNWKTLIGATTAATSATKYLREDGSWQIPVDTKNTAGSTNSTSKLYLIGATSQAANPTTNSYQYTYTDNGLLSALKVGLNLNGTEKAHLEWNDTDQSIDFIFE